MPHPAQHKAATESCPYCGHEITRDELLKIESRIEKEQQQKFEAHTKQLNVKHLSAMSELRKQLAEKDQSKKRELETAHRGHLKELEARENRAKAAEEAARKSEREKVLKEQEGVTEQFRKERQAFDRERKTFKEQKDKLDLAHKKALDRQREVLNADHEKTFLAQKAAADKENHRMQVKLDDMKRQLEKKSNEELGDGAEVDLYNDLKRAFPDDLVMRGKKGTACADITHEVHVDGQMCGKIVYDSKNRGNYKAKYVEQLRTDQLAAKADHAILATRKFPENEKELTVLDGVVLVNPARAVVVARLMREAVIQMTSVRLSEQNKKEKRDRLYEFVTSTRCANQFARFSDEVNHLREIDKREKTQQEKNRTDRARHVGEMEKTVIGELQREIHDILGA